MAKRFRRGVSLLLALILIAGQLTTPVLAAEENTAPTENTTETTTTVPAPDQGTPITESNTTTTTDSQGTTTTTTTTTTTGGGVDAQSTETYSSNASGTQQSLTTDSQSTTTDVGDTTVTTTTDENGDKVKEVSQQSTTVTEEEGESQQTQSVEPQGDGSQKVSGTDTGKSEKTETTTTTTTTEDYDQTLSESTTTEPTTSGDLTEEELEDLGYTEPTEAQVETQTEPTLPSQNDFDDTDWTDGEDKEGKVENRDTTDDESTSGTVVLPIPDAPTTNDGSPVKMDMTLSHTEDTEIVKVTLDDIKAKLAEDYPAADGWTYEPYKDANGKQIGWKAVKAAVVTPDSEGWQDVEGSFNAEVTGTSETTTNTNATLKEYEDKIGTGDSHVEPKEEYVNPSNAEEKGEKEVMYVRDYETNPDGSYVLDANGQKIFKGYKVITTITTTEVSDTGDVKIDDPAVDADSLKPEAGTFVDANGNTTTVTVDPLMENGVQTGWIVNRATTMADGSGTRKESETIHAKPSSKQDIFELPQKPDEGTTTDADGNVTTVTVEPLMENGVQTGWTIHTAFTSADGDAIRNETKNIYAKTGSLEEKTVVDPETQQIITTWDRTYTIVEEITAKEITKTFDVSASKNQTLENNVFTEEEIYLLTNGGTQDLVFTYNGKFYAAQASSLTNLKPNANVPSDKLDQGDVILDNQVATNLTVSTNEADYANCTVVKLDENGNPMRDENGNLILTTMENGDLRFYGNTYNGNMTVSDLYSGQEKLNLGSTVDDWYLYGYGLYTDFLLRDYYVGTEKEGPGYSHQPKQFAIKCGDEIRYVYCVQLGTDITYGGLYNDVKYDGVTGETDKLWNDKDGTAKGDVSDIRKVAVNGYWGTESGMGSLEAVKALMRNNGISEEYIENLTPGMAAAATQMAIWNYGTDFNTVFADTPGGKTFVNWDEQQNDVANDFDKETIRQLGTLLVDIAEGNKKPNYANDQDKTEAITAESITGASITVNNKILDSNGNALLDSEKREQYNTTVSFKVSSGTINGDLILTVTDAAGTHNYRLAGDDNASIFDLFTDRIYPDKNGVFTLENVTMANGQKVDMKIQGIQDLDDGIYLYQNDSEQDFVGLSKRKHTVALEFGVSMEAVDPSIDTLSNEINESRTDTRSQSASTELTQTWKLEKVELSGEMTETITRQRTVRGTVTTTKTLTEKVKEDLHWEAYYEYLLTTTTGDGGFGGGGNGGPGGGNALIIPDEQVPLAVAPATGDVSYIWAAVSVLSLAAYFILSRKPKMV